MVAIGIALGGVAMGSLVPGAHAADRHAIEGIAAVKALLPDEAALRLPVHLVGVVTAANPVSGDLYIQDDDVAVYLAPSGRPLTVGVGDLVEVDGITEAGGFAPRVIPSRLVSRGARGLPLPVPATARSLADSRLDSRRVSVEGLVRVAVRDPRETNGPVVLALYLPDGEVTASVWNRADETRLLGLRGSRVRISGICTPDSNARHQAVRGVVLVTPQDEIEVLDAGLSGALRPPRTPLAQLLQFDPAAARRRFLRIRGTVTAVLSANAFFVQDESGGVCLRFRRGLVVEPGDVVEATGLPRVEDETVSDDGPAGLRGVAVTSLSFQAEEAWRVGREALPAPIEAGADDLNGERLSQRRVVFEAQVIAGFRSEVTARFLVALQAGSVLIDAVGRDPHPAESLPPVGGRVRVQGVLEHRPSADLDSAAIRVHLNGLEDVVLRSPPRPRNTRLLLGAVTATGAIGLLALAWAFTLRRSVRARTKELAAATAARGQFLANMSHEVRTPMNAVLGLIDVLERQSLTPFQADMVRRLATTGRSLLRILNDILDFSRIEAGEITVERRPFELAALLHHLDDLFGEAARGRGLAWRVVSPVEPVGQLIGDPLRLEQVLSNLAANAIKFTHHGEVTVRALVVAPTDEAITLRCEVHDTGVGIAPEALGKLFRPFAQADPAIAHRFGGTGLGLSICRRLVALMGGSVGAESKLGHGSTFWVEIPFARTAGPAAAALPEPPPRSVPQSPRLAGSRILVVDDNRLNLELTDWALRQEGADATLAADGWQALKLLRQHPTRFDAVLMDVLMPGMDGLEAIRSIREAAELRSLPVIVYTAGVLPEQRRDAFAAGATDFVAKPVELEDLVRVLGRWVRPRPEAATAPSSPTALEASLGAAHPSAGSADARVRSLPSASSARAQSQPPSTVLAGARETAGTVPGADDLPPLPGLEAGQAAERLRHDRAFHRRMLRQFRDEFVGLADKVHEDLAAGRNADAARRLHAFRGVTGTLGGQALGREAAALEKSIRDGGAAVEVAEPLERFAARLTDLFAAIARLG